MFLYISGKVQDGITVELEPILKEYIERIQESSENVTFSFCSNPTEGNSDSNTWTYGLYVNLEVDDPICGRFVLWSLFHIH